MHWKDMLKLNLLYFGHLIQTLGDGEGQGSLASCSPWGHKESERTEQLNDKGLCSMPGSSILHYLPEFAQTHVHWVSDAIQPSHLLSPSSPTALNLSQHQGLFQWISCLHQVTKLLELQLQFSISSSSNIQDWFCLELTGLISLQSKGLSRVFSM